MKKDFSYPVISVIVPTFQGAKRIIRTLRSLEKQTFREFETIVVVDGSTDGTEKLIGQSSLSLNLTIISQPNSGRSGARNTGAAKASTEILIFFDDDIEVAANALEKYLARYQQEQTVIVGSLYAIFELQSEFSAYADYLNKKWQSDLIVDGGGAMSRPYISAANFLIQKKTFLAFGGFSNTLKDAEDFDLAIRLFESGVKIFFAPEIKGGHLIQDSFRTYVKRLTDYRVAEKFLSGHNPLAKKYLPKAPNQLGPRRILYKMGSPALFLHCIDMNLFRFLPKSFRFKLYDFILTANTLKISAE